MHICGSNLTCTVYGEKSAGRSCILPAPKNANGRCMTRRWQAVSSVGLDISVSLVRLRGSALWRTATTGQESVLLQGMFCRKYGIAARNTLTLYALMVTIIIVTTTKIVLIIAQTVDTIYLFTNN